jgi:hypothetical protein
MMRLWVVRTQTSSPHIQFLNTLVKADCRLFAAKSSNAKLICWRIDRANVHA